MDTSKGLLTLLAAAIKALFSKTPDIVRPSPKFGLTIAQIMSVAFPAVLVEMRKGHSFVDDELRIMQANGVIELYDLIMYEVKQLVIPLVWSDEDERRMTCEKDKIEFCRRLTENGINSHDFCLLEAIKDTDKIYVSKEHHYDISNVITINIEPEDGSPPYRGYVMKIYTAFCKAS